MVSKGKASGGSIVDGTRTVTVTNANGTKVSESIVDIASGVVISDETASDFDKLGRVIERTFADGTKSTRQYGCCGVDYEVDRMGVRTDYAYDNLGRTRSVSRLGILTEYYHDSHGFLSKDTRNGKLVSEYSYTGGN